MNKRILIVTETLRLGGAEVVAVNLTNNLHQAGREVALAAEKGPLLKTLEKAVPFYSLPRFSPLAIPMILRELKATTEQFRPDVIHCQGATCCLLVRLFYVFSKTRPLIVLTYHSKRTRRIPNFLSGPLFNFIADKIVVIAKHRRLSLLTLGVKETKLFSVPVFIDTDMWHKRAETFDRADFRKKLGLTAGSPVLLMAARLTKPKRADIFLRVIKETRAMGIDARGIVMGTGEEAANLRRLAIEIGIADSVIFTGFAEDKIPYFLASDIFIFPSKSPEVLPQALIEAAAAGLPSLCSAIDGNDEVVADSQTGYVISGDEKAYAAKIQELVKNPELYDTLSAAAKKRAEAAFSMSKCLGDIIKIYDCPR